MSDSLTVAAQAYIDWRDQRLALWTAVAECGHPAGSDCPEFNAVMGEPFDIDQKLDDAIRAALPTPTLRDRILSLLNDPERRTDMGGAQVVYADDLRALLDE